MRKVLSAILGLVFVLTFAGLSEAQNRFWLNLQGDDGSIITDGNCRVVNVGTLTDTTIFTDATLATSKTNPDPVDSLGICDWWLADATTSVDVILWVDSGPYFGAKIRVDGVTPTSQKRVVVPRQHGLKVAVFRIMQTAVGTPDAGTDTTIDIPTGSLLTEALLEVTTHVSTGSDDAGINIHTTTAQDICHHIAATAAGWNNCSLTDILFAAHRSVNYNTSGHNVAGYGYIYFLEPGNF